MLKARVTVVRFQMGFQSVEDPKTEDKMKDMMTEKPTNDDKPYEAPAIVYESVISTRAGSPVIEGDHPVPPAQEDEPVDLFPSD